ncbi:MAG: YhfC family glutamic-type intramembrane protease [Anaerolineae bacterium]
MKRFLRISAILLVALLLVSCANQAVPFSELTLTAPWQDGEQSFYNVVTTDGAVLGAASWQWDKIDSGWRQSYAVTFTNAISGEVTIGSNLLPVSSTRNLNGTNYSTSYLANQVLVTATVGTTVTTNTLTLAPNTLDNDQTLQTQRALPLAAGLSTAYIDLVPNTASSAVTLIKVDGPVTVTVPAGTFSAWHVTMSFGTTKHDAWYAAELPHLLLRYTNNTAGTSFELRAWQAASGAVLQGSTGPAPTPALPVTTSAGLKMNWPYMLLSLLVQVPLMLGISLLAGWQIHKRFEISWNIFLYGAITFVASQVVHLALNYVIGLVGPGAQGTTLWPLWLTALVAGATAGISEQGANLVALGFVWKKLRSYAEGLQFGAGHGSVEAIIAGILSLVTLLNIIVVYFSGTANLGLSADQTQSLVQAFDQVLRAPLYLPLLAALERICALTVQILMAVLVMRALARNKPLLWVAAFGIHTVLDAWAVYGIQTVGTVLTELGILIMAVIAGWLLWRLREPPNAAQLG